jgi:hypothetical protein
MTYDPDDSGEYVRPLPQYLDNLVVEHPVIGTCELWKAIAWDTAQLRNYKIKKRADSAGNVDAAAAKTASEAPPKAPPPVADSAKDKTTQAKIQSALDALGRLETRLDQFEQRKAEEAECARRAEAALALAEKIAEEAPEAMFDALPPAPKQRLN